MEEKGKQSFSSSALAWKSTDSTVTLQAPLPRGHASEFRPRHPRPQTRVCRPTRACPELPSGGRAGPGTVPSLGGRVTMISFPMFP